MKPSASSEGGLLRGDAALGCTPRPPARVHGDRDGARDPGWEGTTAATLAVMPCRMPPTGPSFRLWVAHLPLLRAAAAAAAWAALNRLARSAIGAARHHKSSSGGSRNSSGSGCGSYPSTGFKHPSEKISVLERGF